MHHQTITTSQQLCFRMLCAMEREAENVPLTRRRLLDLTARARRRISQRSGDCTHCVYCHRCQNPDEAKLIKPDQ